jgi:hypothetical protein
MGRSVKLLGSLSIPSVGMGCFLVEFWWEDIGVGRSGATVGRLSNFPLC